MIGAGSSHILDPHLPPLWAGESHMNVMEYSPIDGTEVTRQNANGCSRSDSRLFHMHQVYGPIHHRLAMPSGRDPYPTFPYAIALPSRGRGAMDQRIGPAI